MFCGYIVTPHNIIFIDTKYFSHLVITCVYNNLSINILKLNHKGLYKYIYK